MKDAIAKFRTILAELREHAEDMTESDIRNMAGELVETWAIVEFHLEAGETFPVLANVATLPYAR